MKKMLKLLGIAAIFASVLGFVGCDDSAGGGDDSSPSVYVPVEIPEPTIDGNYFPAKNATEVYEDCSLILKFDAVPTVNRDSGKTVKIFDGNTEVATIVPKNAEIWMMHKDGPKSIKAVDQMISVIGKTVVIKPGFKSSANESVLENGKEYTVVVEDGLITGKIGGAAFTGIAETDGWKFTTRTAPTITEGTITVGADKDFCTLQGALNYLMANSKTGDWTINVDSGFYHENISYKGNVNAKIVGVGEEKPYFYWRNNQYIGNSQRTRQMFYWNGNGNLTLEKLSLENTSSRKVDCAGQSKDVQAETLYFDCDKNLVVYQCKFYSYQDTLLIGGNAGARAWFYQCEIGGDVDFIWGVADVALFEECKIVCRNDNIKKSAEIFASRTRADIDKVGKGFVLLNSEILVEDGCDAYYGRNSNGGDSQATVLGCNVTGKINEKLWNSKGVVLDYDEKGDAAIAFKSFNNRNGNTIISTARKLDGTEDLSERVARREYNGRYAIVNRVFNKTTKRYENASTAWDINAIASGYNAASDNSENNIFVEPVYKKNVVSTTDTVQLTPSSIKDGTLTYTYASGNTSIATVDGNGLVTPVPGASGTVTITVTASNGKTDVVEIAIIAAKIEPQSISLGEFDEAKTIVVDDTLFVTAAFTPSNASIQDVTWVSSDENVITFTDANSTKLGVNECQIIALKAGTATITATSVDKGNVTKTSATITVSDAEKTVGTVPAEGYTFRFIALDSSSKDGFLAGGKTATTKINYNVGSTGTGEKGSGTDNVLGGKYITLLKSFGQATLRVANNLNNLQMKNTSGHRPEDNQWKTSDCVGPAGTDALVLKGVQGPVKITPTLGKVSSNRTFAAMICPSGATTAEGGTFAKWVPPTSENYEVMEGFGYEGDSVVDIYFGGTNDIDIISIKLEPYTPPTEDVSIAFSTTTMMTLDLNGTKTEKREATLDGADKDKATVTYTSDNTDIATVSSDGTVTAVGMGIATITAKESIKKQTATYQVMVKDTTATKDSYVLDFTKYAGPKEGNNNPDFGAFSVANAKYNGTQHGWAFGSSSTLSIPVTGACTVTVTGCTFDAADLKYSVKDSGDTKVKDETATSTRDVSDGTGTYAFAYTGTGATVLTISFTDSAFVHKIQVVSSNAGTAYAEAKKYDFTKGADYTTYTGYTTALNGFQMTGGNHHNGDGDNTYGWDMKVGNTLTLVVSGDCTVKIAGTQHSGLDWSVAASAGTITPTTATGRTAEDVKEDAFVFTYTGGEATLTFTTVANNGNDMYVPSVTLTYTN